MARAHAEADDPTPFRMVYSVRTPDDVYFADELQALAEASVASTAGALPGLAGRRLALGAAHQFRR